MEHRNVEGACCANGLKEESLQRSDVAKEIKRPNKLKVIGSAYALQHARVPSLASLHRAKDPSKHCPLLGLSPPKPASMASLDNRHIYHH